MVSPRLVGTALLDAVMAHARASGAHAVRLDVIDTNPRARALYARLGWEPAHTRSTWPLARVFGFSSATTMLRSVS